MQRGAHFALIDEADSILIDEARTPLIIGSLGDTVRDKIVAAYRWAAAVAEQFDEDEHYDYEHDTKKVELTVRGRQLVRALPKETLLSGIGLVDLLRSLPSGRSRWLEITLLPRPAVHRPRRGDRHRRRIHGSLGRGPQVAGWNPPGDRGQGGSGR